MRLFTGEKTVSSILRLGYAGSPKLGNYGTVGSCTCYLRPLTEEQAALNGYQYGTSFSAIFETSIDVQEGDRLVISTVTYQVRGVVNHDRGRFTSYKRAILQKPEKA